MLGRFRVAINRVLGLLKPWVIDRHLLTKPMTLMFPEESLEPVEGYRGRQFLELEKCVGCGVCVSVCPNKALELVEFEEGKYPQIHLGKCCFCGLCEEHCPRNALTMTPMAMISLFDKTSAVYGPDKLSQPLKQ